MKRVLYFVTVNKRVMTLFLTLFLSIMMMFMGAGPKERFVRTVTSTIFNTGQFTFSWGIYMLDLWSENKRLRDENFELATQIHENYLAARENDTLRGLLEFKEKYPFEAISALVIGQDVDRIVNALILDVGSRDGVRRNMAVVTAEGLVGRIHEVYPFSCSVQIIQDVNSRISAMVNGDRSIKGIVRWEGGEHLRLYLLQHISEPTPGQLVYTTGLGGTYPEGLYIGKVSEVQDPDVKIYASINIDPAVNFSQTHEVFILSGSERSDIWDDGDGTGNFTRPELQ